MSVRRGIQRLVVKLANTNLEDGCPPPLLPLPLPVACPDRVPLSRVVRHVWGGMQYQLEHHLFPTLPRYKYRALVPLVRKFAEENGIDYRATGQWEIIKDNINLVRACVCVCLCICSFRL